MLPPGPRDYWNELAAEHKNVLEHQKWMYDADPFAARRMVDERQAKAVKEREDVSSTAESSRPGGHGGSGSHEFVHAPEVKMAGSLRELVEDCIKKVLFIVFHYSNVC